MDLNVWKKDWYKWTCIKGNFLLFFRKIKWSFQRIKRGYSDYDVWSLDCYLAELISKTTMHLAETTHSYPGRGSFDTEEKWDSNLRNMSYLFSLYNKEIRNKYEDALAYLTQNKTSLEDFYKDKMWICFMDEASKIDKTKKDALNEGFDLLKDCFEDLWD